MDSDIKILALSHYEDYAHVTGMVRAGSSGYLLKECQFEEALKTIETIMASGTYDCQKVTRLLLDRGLSAEGQDSQLSRISQDNVEIIQMLANRKSAGQIATKLSMSVNTIEAKRRQIMRQLRQSLSLFLFRYFSTPPEPGDYLYGSALQVDYLCRLNLSY